MKAKSFFLSIKYTVKNKIHILNMLMEKINRLEETEN